MAITNRSELETAMDNWAARDDIDDSRKQECIALFEAVANRRLRVRQMEASEDITTSSGAYDLSGLTEPFNAVRSLVWNGSPERVLDYYTPRLFHAKYPAADGVSEEGVPTIFTIEGSTLKTKPIDDDTDAFTLRYWARLDALDSSSATNWLLTEYPDCYLAGAMHEFQAYLLNPEMAVLWKAKRDEIFAEIIQESNKSMGPMVVRPIGVIV